jgi:hypothetical protein
MEVDKENQDSVDRWIYRLDKDQNRNKLLQECLMDLLSQEELDKNDKRILNIFKEALQIIPKNKKIEFFETVFERKYFVNTGRVFLC